MAYTYSNLINYVNNRVSGSKVSTDVIATFLISYASGNSIAKAAKEAGISTETASSWKRDREWFSELLSVAQEVVSGQTDRKMSLLLDKSLNALAERLEGGDPYLAKDGTIQFKPVAAQQAARIMAILYEKRALIRNQPTSIKGEKEISTEERLNELGRAFEEVSKLKVVK